MKASDILDRLIALSEDKIWASELALSGRQNRIDFWTLEPAASTGFRATSYEIKVSREDFKRDTEDKQRSAISYSDRFWYVTPPNLLRRDELPEWAGLLEAVDDAPWKVVRRAPKLQKREPDWDFVVSLMRNCGRSRRDVGMLMAQLAYFQHAQKQREQGERSRAKWAHDRWVRRTMVQNKVDENGDPVAA